MSGKKGHSGGARPGAVTELFGALITDEIRNLARARLLGRIKNLAPRGCDLATREKATLALLLIKEINDRLRPKDTEAALIYGVSERSMRGKNAEEYRKGL
jgi:hypothetical protein